MAWTTQQVEALAPDPESVRAGKGLASQHHWPTLGANVTAAWGECKGSGSKPYQVRVDLSNGGSKCTCPSRKFPCKHALGVLFLLSAEPALFTQNEAPGWVTEWLLGRQERAEKRAAIAEQRAAIAVDPEAQAKRIEKRTASVEGSLDVLELWMRDLISRGLDWSRQQPATFWNGMERRLIDAKAPGLANMVARVGEDTSSGTGWDSRALSRLGQISLLTHGLRHLDSLPPSFQADVRAAVGITMGAEQVLDQGEMIRDQWHVVGTVLADSSSPVRTQRQWFRGRQTGRDLLILNFAHRSAPLPLTHPVGAILQADIAYYPGTDSLRGLIKDTTPNQLSNPCATPEGQTIREALDRCHLRWALCPWTDQQPLILANSRILRKNGQVWLVDSQHDALPIDMPKTGAWVLLAMSAGHPCTVMGEWNGERLLPLTAWREGIVQHLRVELE